MAITREQAEARFPEIWVWWDIQVPAEFRDRADFELDFSDGGIIVVICRALRCQGSHRHIKGICECWCYFEDQERFRVAPGWHLWQDW